MKRVLLFVGVPLVVAIVLFLLLLDQRSASNTLVLDERSLEATQPDEPAEPTVGADAGGVESQITHPAPPDDVRPARIERLADGDSFDIRWLDSDEFDEVRLFGINAPEANACFGGEARGLLEALTADQELLIESIERDEFGRVLANVWVGNVLINLRLVEQGAALGLTDGSRYAEQIQNAQVSAETTQAGLWDPAFCGADDQGPQVSIAEIFEDAPGQDNLNPNGEWIDIANTGVTDADMTDWSIRDESTRHRFFFPDGFVLFPGTRVRVFSGCGDDDALSLYWCDGDPVWNNSGDTAFLVDPEGRFADTLSYQG